MKFKKVKYVYKSLRYFILTDFLIIRYFLRLNKRVNFTNFSSKTLNQLPGGRFRLLGKLELLGADVVQLAETNGDHSGHETYHVIRHAEVRHRQADQQGLTVNVPRGRVVRLLEGQDRRAYVQALVGCWRVLVPLQETFLELDADRDLRGGLHWNIQGQHGGRFSELARLVVDVGRLHIIVILVFHLQRARADVNDPGENLQEGDGDLFGVETRDRADQAAVEVFFHDETLVCYSVFIFGS